MCVVTAHPFVPLDAMLCASGRALGEPRLSPDGRTLLAVATTGEGARFVVLDAATGAEVPVLADPPPRSVRPLAGGTFDWRNEGASVVYAADGGLWQHTVATGQGSRVWATDAGLTGIAVAADGRVACVVDQGELVVVDTDGHAVVVSAATDFVLDPAWSPDGSRVAWVAWDAPSMPWDDARVVVAAADADAPARVVAGGGGSAAQQPRFAPDGESLSIVDDRSGWLNVTLLDPSTGDALAALSEPFEHAGPPWGAGQRSYAWHPRGTSLAVCRNENGFGALAHWRPGSDPITLGRGVHGGLSWRGSSLAAVRTGGRTPTQVVVYEGVDRGDGDEVERRSLAVGPDAAIPGVEPELVSWPANDGTEIPARLYRPLVETATPPPMLVWVHGGPTDQWQVEYRPRIVYWLTRGWSVLVPDHRGSTGHGREFTQAMAGRWGEVDVDDVVGGAKVAVERGWADPRRLVAMGASAGGFTVLHALARHPRLFAAGVALYPVADLLDMGVDRFEAHYNVSLVGALPGATDRYRDRSPIAGAEAIEAPLLVMHGTDDQVVPVRQSVALAERMSRAGRSVELHLYEGEGHGWGRPEVVVDELERTETFLYRHVPSR
jgi:dipeptidyl aminopeptidase/acylaminoacyl peptidase